MLIELCLIDIDGMCALLVHYISFLHASTQSTDVLLQLTFLKKLIKCDWSEIVLISEYHILESLLEPEGGDYFDVLKLECPFQGLSFSFTPN